MSHICVAAAALRLVNGDDRIKAPGAELTLNGCKCC
jgi:hypothetical protein